jgi:hypothetical protein
MSVNLDQGLERGSGLVPHPLTKKREIRAYRLFIGQCWGCVTTAPQDRLLDLDSFLRRDMSDSNEVVVFYSWQTDSPKETNLHAIRSALRRASSKLETLSSGDGLKINLEEATRNEPGSPNIPQTIIAKIELSHIFVCDVTTINHTATGVKRKTPNPNVTWELGYAVSKLGWQRIVMLLNTAYGPIEDLPFDFDRHRASPYRLQEDSLRSAEVAKLEQLVFEALRVIIATDPPYPTHPLNPEQERRRRDIINLRWVMESIHLPSLERHIVEAPGYIRIDLFHFYESFEAIFNSKSFHLYDLDLLKRLKRVHKLWAQSLAFYEHYEGDLRGGSRFSERRTKEQRRDWRTIVSLVRKLGLALDDLLLAIREKYLEINLDETSESAWDNYVAFNKRFDTMLAPLRK